MAENKLWSRSFSRLWACEGVSVLSAQMLIFALPIVAVSTFQATDAQIGLINTFVGLGLLTFLIVGASLTDLRRQDKLLGALSLARAMICGFAAFAAATDALALWHLLIIGFAISGMTALYDSAFSAVVPQVVHTHHLGKANSWIAALRSAADIGAGSLAGILLSYTGSATLFCLLMVFYAIASIGPFSLRPIFKRKPKLNSSNHHVFSQIMGAREGIRFLLSDPIQRPITLAIAHFNLFTSAIQALYVVFALRYANLSAAEIGVAASIAGVIGLCGVFISDWSIKKIRPVVLLSVTLALPVLSGAGILILPLLDQFASMLVLSASLGLWACAVLVNVAASETLKQQLVPEAILGRVSAAIRLLTWGVDPIGAGLATLAVLYLPIHSVLMISIIGIGASVSWLLTSSRLRKLSPTPTSN